MADETDLPPSNQGEPAPPCAMVIFGASGDLTKRKLIPAIHNLATHHLLPENFAVIGVSRSAMSDDEFRNRIRDEMKEFATGELKDEVVEWLLPRLFYLPGEFHDDATFEKLRERLQEADEKWSTKGCYLFYLAVPPSQFSTVVQQLGESGLVEESEGQWRRVVIEKPFGHDLESARVLNREILQVLDERQIYRIDHYLGKETVQNILAFRFANGIFEPIWNRRYVDHVQITVAETVGVEGRGSYYEEAGALRDMVQNHMFQLLAITAMEPPTSFAPDSVRDERVKVLCAVKPFEPEDVLRHTVRGQYEGYRQEPNVKPDSTVETYVALELHVENWRWAGVPFYLRTGKRLPRRVTEIAIQFKSAPFVMFRETPVEQLNPNLLVIRIQPEEGISLRFEGKVPGPVMRLGTVKMEFRYADYFGTTPSTGYETLLYDVMTADSTLFHRSDMVEAGWKVVTPILDVWKALTPRSFPNYAAETWGPKDADELMKDGRKWRN
ncbi:MAG TPA: glucose-6-phosphate dehydrogenase [Thermoanaerobaculia bacterium]|nr:glucose-6-phosphate dehydrogenase [Thermoanaerobaculia bacterium]